MTSPTCLAISNITRDTGISRLYTDPRSYMYRTLFALLFLISSVAYARSGGSMGGSHFSSHSSFSSHSYSAPRASTSVRWTSSVGTHTGSYHYAAAPVHTSFTYHYSAPVRYRSYHIHWMHVYSQPPMLVVPHEVPWTFWLTEGPQMAVHPAGDTTVTMDDGDTTPADGAETNWGAVGLILLLALVFTSVGIWKLGR